MMEETLLIPADHSINGQIYVTRKNIRASFLEFWIFHFFLIDRNKWARLAGLTGIHKKKTIETYRTFEDFNILKTSDEKRILNERYERINA